MANVWKIAPGKLADNWSMCQGQGCIVIGWEDLGDFQKYKNEKDIIKALKKRGGGKGSGTGAARTISRFVHEIQPYDVIVANKGESTVVGIGRVTGKYLPPEDPDNPVPEAGEWLRNARRVDWLVDRPIDLHKKNFFVASTITHLRPEQCDQIKQAYLKTYPKDPELKEKLDQLFGDSGNTVSGENGSGVILEAEKMKALLGYFRQVIVYGPPGTGKTREAMRVALALLSGKEPGAAATPQEIDKKLKEFTEAKRFDLVVFHPAYEYEQFVGGIEPIVKAGQLVFQAKAGVFLRLCRAAEKHQLPTVLIIDEINRGNLPKLLGELVYALEYRDHEVRLPFDDGRTDLIVPKNLYIIATMNSADRSIGHIDVAIRRRFGVYHLPPNSDVVQSVWTAAGDASYGEQLAELMERLNKTLGTAHDSSAEAELGVGHSYFLPAPGSSVEDAKQQVQMKWEYQVQPLLREYGQLLNLGADFQGFFKKSLDQALAEP